jgi:predicted phage terminase large subunit-like protein
MLTFKRTFTPRNEVEWLTVPQRRSYVDTIQTLTDLYGMLEMGHELNEAQSALLRKLSQSDAKDTHLHAIADILERTELGYTAKLAAMAPYDLTAYHELMNPGEVPALHHQYLAAELMAVAEGKLSTLIVALPPGSAKSAIASRSFAQWMLGRNPDWRILAVANTQKFVEDEISKPNRNALEDERYQLVFPDVRLSQTDKGASFWKLDGWRGSYAARGALAGTAGLRARLILGDDLIKNAQDALSPTVRETLWRWWGADVMSRRLPNCPVVLVNCLTGDTPVLMGDGSWKPIRDIRVGDLVVSHRDGEQTINPVENWMEQEEDDVIEVNTSNGRVKCNARHPFWTKKGWVNAGDLTKDDEVLHSGAVHRSEECSVTPDQARIDEPFYWRKVVSVKPLGYKEKLYDMQVAQDHNFIADGCVVSNTLWHSQDVPGRLKAMHDENPNTLPLPFKFINIPAQAKEDDILGRKPGEWLWCKDQQADGFYSIIDYETKRAITPPSLWSALYLGEPLDQQGAFIEEDKFQRYDVPPINKEGHEVQWKKTIISIDTAQKGNERSDYTAIVVMRQHVNGTYYMVDAWRGKENLEDIIQTIAKLMRLWQVNYAIIEDSGMGTQIIENYANKLPAPVMKYSPSGKGSKEFRFDAAAPWITSGRVLFPREATWITDFINELVAFPSATNDDWVDAFSQFTDHELKHRRGGTKPLKMRG